MSATIIDAATSGANSEPSRPGELDLLLQRAIDVGATDVHLMSGEQPRMRRAGQIEACEDLPPTKPQVIEAMLELIVPADRLAALQGGDEVDFAYELARHRFRATAFRERRGPAAAFRLLSGTPPTLAELHLPRDLARVVYAPGGLALFAGPAGAGKTTTLASVLQELLTWRPARVVTLEDPIEYRLEPRRAWVEQRELGRHFSTFETGLREALESSPDAIAIGELRDPETVRLALEAAETGILVLATVHAYDATRAIGRIVDAFPMDERPAARMTLGVALRMIVAQLLLRTTKGDARVPAIEVCFGGTSIATLVREGREHELTTVIEAGRGHGMRKLDDAIVELVRSGRVTREEGLYFAIHRENVERLIGAG